MGPLPLGWHPPVCAGSNPNRIPPPVNTRIDNRYGLSFRSRWGYSHFQDCTIGRDAMSKFNELVGLARGEGFAVTPEYLDSVEAAHAEVLSEIEAKGAGDSEIWTNEKLELEAALAERDSLISELKSKNYDMLTQVPGNSGGDGDPGDDDDDDIDDEDDATVDDLFE